eukprot:5442866-Prymnesium_polylepis.1
MPPGPYLYLPCWGFTALQTVSCLLTGRRVQAHVAQQVAPAQYLRSQVSVCVATDADAVMCTARLR